MPTYLFLPDVDWLPKKDDVNIQSDAEAIQLAVAADSEPIRLIYGETRVGAQIAVVTPLGDFWIILAVWGQGPVEAISELKMDDKDLPVGVTFTHYLGTTSQTPDSLLVSAYANKIPVAVYNDSLAKVAYTVFKIPAAITSFNLSAKVKGLKVYDPRSTLTAWSDNPSLCLADFLINTEYGAKKNVDWTSVGAAADFNDTMIGTPAEKQRTINLVIDSVNDVKSWIEVLRLYASCWVAPSGNVLKLVKDAPVGSTVASYNMSNIFSMGQMKKRGLLNVPTVMHIEYTDTATIPYRTRRASVYAPGVLAGTTPKRESVIQMPGVIRYSQAYREAVERLNKLTITDLSFNIVVPDIGITVEVGDVIDVTHSIGLSAKPMRIAAADTPAAGDWNLNLIEYDPNVFCSDVISTPSYPDTSIASPNSPQPGTALVLTERLFRDQAVNLLRSQLQITWTAPANYPFVKQYRVQIYDGSDLVDSSSTLVPGYTSAMMQQDRLLTVKVFTEAPSGALSSSLDGTITTVGKRGLFPPQVTHFDGFEVGGRVYSKWDKSTDDDVLRYEIRYAPTAASPTWDTATLIDRVDTLAKTIEGIAAGSYRFFIKAIDSIGQYSVTASSKDIIVTVDQNFAILDTIEFTTASLTNVTAFRLPGDPLQYYATDSASTWDSKFPLAMDNYGNAIATYFSSVSEYLSTPYDFGLSVTAQWTLTANVSALVGTFLVEMGLSDDNVTWNYSATTSQKATARFIRVRVSCATGNSFKISGNPTIRAQVVTKSEFGSINSSATLPATVLLSASYAKFNSIALTPKGSGSGTIAAQFDQVALYPMSGEFIYLESTLDGTGLNRYSVRVGISGTYVIQAGDYLWWDEYAIDQSDDGGCTISFASGLDISTTNDTGGNIINNGVAAGFRSWVTRHVDIGTAKAGFTFLSANVQTQGPQVGKHRALFRNIFIGDSSGTVRQVIWSSGAVLNRAVRSSVGATNGVCNRGNAFDVYALDGSGTKLATNVAYAFSGV